MEHNYKKTISPKHLVHLQDDSTMWPGLGKVWCIGLLITTSTELVSLKLTSAKNFKLT